MLEIASNIVKYRHNCNVTQEELAKFLGVTKASISKWETRQSYPDILLLPKIASYFNVTIDELLGYEPKIDKSQVKSIYEKLAGEFANIEYDEVISHIHELVNTYYSSFMLLNHIVLLIINHYMLAPSDEGRKEVLEWAVRLCEHIIQDCDDMVMSRDAVVMKAVCNLLMGKALDVIDEMKALSESDRMSLRPDVVLVQAYQMAGDIEKADMYSELNVYTHLISLVSDSISLLGIHINDYDYGMVTIKRVRTIVDAYKLGKLNENITLQFYYQAAVFFSTHSKTEEALDYLERYVDGSITFLDKEIVIHGDDYFKKLDGWFRSNISSPVPRSIKVIRDSLLPSIKIPVFACLADNTRYRVLLRKLDF